MTEDKENRGDHAVGYKKPPKEHQFKKGQSGNPKGRPPANKTQQLDLAAFLDQDVEVKKGGKTIKMSEFEIRLRSLLRKTLKDKSVSAAMKFIQHCEKHDIFSPPQEKETSGGVMRVPRGWDLHDYHYMYVTFGPPPWKGDGDDGMFSDDELKERENVWK